MGNQSYTTNTGLTNEMLEKFMETAVKEQDGLAFMICDLQFKMNRILELLQQTNHGAASGKHEKI